MVRARQDLIAESNQLCIAAIPAPEKKTIELLTLRLPQSASPGSYASFRVIERAEAQISGGITFIVRTE